MAALVRNVIRVLGTWVAAGDTITPPSADGGPLLTEAGDYLTTETGDHING